MRVEVEHQSLALLRKLVIDQPADGRGTDAPKRAVFEIGDLRSVGPSVFFTADDLSGD